ncbi:MAG: ribosome biogenesis GTPase YlqF [Firmicutes bacterium]|nr:ribosome biogenesis GTPase YlqF [Bacillota bacterium]
MKVNWYPGHMKKTKELLQKNLKLVDVVFEILDSRIPISSKNPDIDKITGQKPRIVILNKSDLSSEAGNNEWLEYFNKKNIPAVLVNGVTGSGIKNLFNITNKLMKNRNDRLIKKGIKNKPIRAMIVGVPNVGKSTVINALTGKRSAKTGNKPGVTKGKQWIKLKGNIELLDTPGILWPKLDSKTVSYNLAFTGAIKDDIVDIETLGLKLVENIIKKSPKLLIDRYNIVIEEEEKPLEVLNSIAIKRGCIIKGGEIDYTRVTKLIIDEYRKGKIGKITLELPKDIVEV